jgi:hypothetical protein
MSADDFAPMRCAGECSAAFPCSDAFSQHSSCFTRVPPGGGS